MFFPQTNFEGWFVLPDEMIELALRQDWLDGMLATVKRLSEIIVTTPLSEVERLVLLSQLWNIQQHLRESVDRLIADRLLRNN